ncbi:hypothetical protein [Neobacillus niacini]|uniref:hypothetical protein n=1 Tax=Neobacillus niacini TaxID=86668 RepID=UPI00398316ED
MLLTEKGFGMDDYFVIAAVIISWGSFIILPKIFSKQLIILIILFSLTVPSIMDNSFAVFPFDYYDILDGPEYTIMDLVVYLLYPPFGYFFLYFYKRLQIRIQNIFLYISAGAFLSVCFEWINHKLGVFHYKNGYQIIYSFCFYLVCQTILILYYQWIKTKH